MGFWGALDATQLAGLDRGAALSLTQQVIETVRQSGYPPGYDRQLPLLEADSALDTLLFCDATRTRICLRTRTALLTATPSITFQPSTPGLAAGGYADVQVSTRWSVRATTQELQLGSRIAARPIVETGQLMLGQWPPNLPAGTADASPPAVLQVDSSGLVSEGSP